MRLIASLLVAVLVLGGASSAPAVEGNPYVTVHELDLVRFLAPPVPLDSPLMRAELAEVLKVQVTRTPEMEARAIADVEETPWRFADILGPKLVREALPRTEAFFKRVAASESAVVDPAKNHWARPRPFMMSDLVRPVTWKSTSGSYPSGHATYGTLAAIMLAEMVPERRAEIMARGAEYARNRVVAGNHFPSDVEAGRIAGHLIAFALLAREEARADFEAARAELRAALGL
jgi:acid phosphatase (class A)